MKRIFALLLVAGFLAGLGCNTSPTTKAAGGTGGTTPTSHSGTK